MSWRYELTFDLFRIYLRDNSEKANISSIDAITRAFQADSGAIFYATSEGQFRFCLAGAAFPITLSSSQWLLSISRQLKKDGIDTFMNWSPPGFDSTVRYWMSTPLYASGSGGGFVFLGRNSASWTGEEGASLEAIAGVVSEIVDVRDMQKAEMKTRKKVEEKLALTERRMGRFFEHSRDMIYTTDALGCFTSINKAGLELLGLSDDRDVLGKTFADFSPSPDVHDWYFQRIAQYGYVDDFEIVLKNKDGMHVFCSETAHVLKDEDGQILEIQGSIKDISDRIEHQQELWKMNMELVQTNSELQQTRDIIFKQEKLAAIGQLAAGIAHEINNPLGFLRSNHSMLSSYTKTLQTVCSTLHAKGDPFFVDLSRQNDLPYVMEEIEHMIAENDDGFNRIVKIVSNLLSFSRSGQASDLELYNVVSGMENTLVVAWNEIKYVAEVQRDFSDVPPFYAHGGELNQVFLNMLVNAAQAIGGQKRSEKGLITIAIRQEGDAAVIRITDDGPGILPEVKARLFDPFFTTKEPGKGTGLGLSISYDIVVNKHQGTITVDSQPGSGSTFTITIPLVLHGLSTLE